MNVAGVALDLLYPRACHHCGANADAGSFLCWECMAGIMYVQTPFCSLCGDPVPGHIDHEYLCVQCSREQPFFDAARSAVRHESIMRQAIVDMKYHHSAWLAADLVNLLEACYRAHYAEVTFDAVCYVPLLAVKRRERGFNQAELLAGALAVRLQLPVIKRALKRTRFTVSQTRLTAVQRSANTRGLFATRRPREIKDKQLLLIDDVMTTGATVNDCARALKEAGAQSVHVLTVARG